MELRPSCENLSNYSFSGMLCKFCQAQTKYDGIVWATVPCIRIFHHSLTRHQASGMHNKAVDMEATRKRAEQDGGISVPLCRQFNVLHWFEPFIRYTGWPRRRLHTQQNMGHSLNIWRGEGPPTWITFTL